MKFIKWFFNYGVKYRKQVEKYEDNNRTIGPIANFIVLVFTTAIPLLALWGMFKLPWSEYMWILKILCGIFAFASIMKVPSELMIFSVVAIRHGFKTRIATKMENMVEQLDENIVGEQTKELASTAVIKEKRTKPVWDFIIGTIGILLSIGVVIAFVVLFFWFLSNLGA